MSLRAQVAWAALVFLAVSVLFIGVRPLVSPDEARYGIMAAEMAESGEWFALRMAGFHYYEKPPLGMWLMGASISLFGETATAIRIPSMLATAVSALAAGWLAGRITRRREIGVAAFLVQATTIGPLVMGGVASLDPIFSAFVAATLAAFYGACTSSGRARIGWLALAGVASALAFLTKGLLGFAIPAVSALAFLAWQRRWRDIVVLPWVPLAVAAAVAAPIAWMLHDSEPTFWEAFLFIEHFRRFAAPDANQHTQPWWYLLLLFPVGALCWTLLWPRVWRSLRAAGALNDGMRFTLCWIAAPLMALSLSKGKVPTYVLPLYPALAAVVTIALFTAHESGHIVAGVGEQCGRWLLRILAVVAVAFALVGGESLGVPTLWPSHESLRWVSIAAALIIWSELDALSWRARTAQLWLMRTATAPIAMLMLIPFLFPSAFVRESQLPWAALEANQQSLVDAPTLITTAQLGHCVSWVTGRRDLVIAGSPGEFDNELDMAVDRARLLSWQEVSARIIRGDGIALVVTLTDFDRLLTSPTLPPPDASDTRGDLVIVSWKRSRAAD